MPNPIESIARQATTSLTGAIDPKDVGAQQDARGGALVRNLATGGLALGAGTGALVALFNYLKSMKEENELEDESRMNDDTLYIPATKSAADGDVNRWLAPGIALTGGILSAGGAYALTQAVYNHLQKKHRQKMLDEAQGEALIAADLEAEKAASTDARMTFWDLAQAFPVAVPMLAALASGGVAFAALRKTFPTVKAPKSKYPKRVRQVSQTGDISDLPEEDATVKTAADHAGEADVEDAANEFLILTVDQVAFEKSATMRLTSDILNRVAKDGLTGVVSIQKEGGMEALVESVKGASDDPVDLPNKVLAAAAICKSARLRPVVTMLASAEFQELVPDLYETALSYGEESLEKFAGIAPLMHLAYFRPLILEKSAMQNPLVDELEQLTELPQGMPQAPQGVPQSLLQGVGPEDMENSLTSDVNGSGADEAEGDEAEEVESMRGGGEEDPVDDLLSAAGEESPILDPVESEEEEESLLAPMF